MAEFDNIADELYALPPEQFAAARDEAVKTARGEKQTELAKELGKLRRPTLSAWLINLLWRDQREVMEQLFELASELSQAQARAAGGELRELMAQRRQIERALLLRGKQLVQDAGGTVSDAVEREAQETLSAALANPEVADEVRSGRLVKPATFSGFGGPVPSAVPQARPKVVKETPAEEPPRVDELAARRAREKREAAERKLAEAQGELKAATDALASSERESEAAGQRKEALDARVEQLREQLAKVEREASEAEKERRGAERRREMAEKARSAAEKEVARAEKELAALD